MGVEQDLERRVSLDRLGSQPQLRARWRARRARAGLRTERGDAASVFGPRGGLRAEVVGRARPGVVVGRELRPLPAPQERADLLDEPWVVNREPPFRQRVRLARMGAVERLVRSMRSDAGSGQKHVVPDHVDVGVTGVERLRRPRAAGFETRDRVPDHRQSRCGIDRQLPADRRQPEPAQLRIDLTPVEDQVRAPERLLVRRRRMRGASRGAVESRRRVEVPRVVHLRHHPHVHRSAVGGDRLVQRDQIAIAAAGCDPSRCDRLGSGSALVGADVDHRDRLQTREELRERRPPGAALPPAEEDVPHLRVLAGLALEAVGLARDPEQRLVVDVARAPRSGCSGGEHEHQQEKRGRRPHELSIGRNTDDVQIY